MEHPAGQAASAAKPDRSNADKTAARLLPRAEDTQAAPSSAVQPAAYEPTEDPHRRWYDPTAGTGSANAWVGHDDGDDGNRSDSDRRRASSTESGIPAAQSWPEGRSELWHGESDDSAEARRQIEDAVFYDCSETQDYVWERDGPGEADAEDLHLAERLGAERPDADDDTEHLPASADAHAEGEAQARQRRIHSYFAFRDGVEGKVRASASEHVARRSSNEPAARSTPSPRQATTGIDSSTTSRSRRLREARPAGPVEEGVREASPSLGHEDTYSREEETDEPEATDASPGLTAATSGDTADGQRRHWPRLSNAASQPSDEEAEEAIRRFPSVSHLWVSHLTVEEWCEEYARREPGEPTLPPPIRWPPPSLAGALPHTDSEMEDECWPHWTPVVRARYLAREVNKTRKPSTDGSCCGLMKCRSWLGEREAKSSLEGEGCRQATRPRRVKVAKKAPKKNEKDLSQTLS